MITVKQYRCPMCGHPEKHSTNHCGEIYTGCRSCGHAVLYCDESEAKRLLEAQPYVTAVLHSYNYYIGNIAVFAAYFDMVSRLETAGLKPIKVLPATVNGCHAEAKHDGETIRLYDPQQWPDQYISNIGRLYRWLEYVLPNNRCRVGYWLDINWEDRHVPGE